MIYEARDVADTPEERGRCEREALGALSELHRCPIHVRYTWTKGAIWNTVSLHAESRELTMGEFFEAAQQR